MTSEAELYPTLTPQQVAEFQRLDQERLRSSASDEVTGELGHLAIAMVSGGAVNADTLSSAEYSAPRRQQEIDTLEAQFSLEAIQDSQRNTLRNLGSVATLDSLYGYNEALTDSQKEADMRAALQQAAKQQYDLAA